MAETIYLVDGSGYIFRAFYAIAHLTNKEGFPTNALFGFSKMLLKLIKEADSRKIVMVFDAGRKTFRSELYSEYKANRTECPEELVLQMPYFRDLSRAIGVPVIELPGYEADDIIGTLAKRLENLGHPVVVVSGDKDLLQLVGENVVVWDTMKDKRYKRPEVIEKFGVPPEKVVEVLALIGDDSDNVPGLKGVGPKTAAQLIQRYGSAEVVLESAGAIAEDPEIRNRKKIAEAVVSQSDIVRISRKLVEIDCAAPVKLKLTEGEKELVEFSDEELIQILSLRETDQVLLSDLIERFEFQSLLGDFKLPEQLSTDADYNYKSIDVDSILNLLNDLIQLPTFAFDCETTSLSPHDGRMIGFSICYSDIEAFYVPYSSIIAEKPELEIIIKEKLQDIFGRSDLIVIGQNLKFDLQVLFNLGIDVRAKVWDTMIASYVTGPDRGSHNLTTLSRDFLQRKLIEYEDIVEKGSDFSSVPLDVATRYCCQDSHCAWLLKEKLSTLISDAEVFVVFEEIELPLVSVLARMEFRGIKLDTDKLAHLSKEFGDELVILEKQIVELAGGSFNINSPKQLAQVLFERLNLPTKGLKKTKTGISTDSSVLEKLAGLHPLPAKILDYRSIHKLKSTYVDALPEQISATTGRLHTRLNQAITGTGRLSSSDPNLQNIPVQTAQGRRIRESFIADQSKNKVLISADYSQIELRVLAHLSNDAGLIDAFLTGIDVHAKTAREILGMAPDAVITSEMRRMGKTINFGVIYGMGPFRLARELEIPLNVANSYIEGYFARYPGVREYFEKIEEEADSAGFVSTLYGRRRWLSHIDASGRDQGFVKRAALNAPIQGTAADLMKLAMIQIESTLSKEQKGTAMLLQIHDELLFEADKNEVDSSILLIKEAMEGVAQLKVPLVAEIGVGNNWQEAHS